MSIFDNRFFSVAGQKERLQNVVDTLKIAVNPFSSQKITATTASPAVNKALEAVANNPYTTAGALALGATAAGIGIKTAASIAAAATPKVAAAAAAAGTSTILKTAVIAGAAGAAAGAVLSGSGGSKSSTAPQTQSLNLTPSQITSPSQITNYNTQTTNTSAQTTNTSSRNIITGSPYASIYNPLDTTQAYNPLTSLNQNPNLSSSPSQDTSGSQAAAQTAAAGATNPLMLLAIGAAALYLYQKK
jgi:hypothetical protein